MPTPPSAVYTVLQAALADPAPPDAGPVAAVATPPAPLVTLLSPLVTAAGGHLLPTPAAAPCAVFPTTPAAVRAAVALQRALQGAAAPPRPGLPVRLALHRGPLAISDGSPDGPTLDRLAHLLATGHGGQILLSQAVTLDLALTPPAGVFLRDLGRHRLADLALPERVAQVTVPDLPADFPPLRSLDAFRHNLPVHPTSFVGRSTELATVRLRLADAATGGPRLLTLIGPGGTGKTRLALHAAAAHLAQFADGVQLVELAPLADPALLPQAVAAVLGVREEPARPLLATLITALQARHLLLLLDNCEHLISAAAELTAALLSACPRLVILASSREALGLPGESVFRVPPLALPDPRTPAEAGRDSAAGRLFLDRACAVRPDLVVTAADSAAVTTICRRLDGIPLALELAAAQARELPVAEIAARLDDRFRLLTGGSRTALPRQQTLHALIDWSWDLLRPAEQRLLARLGVFVGGWTAATASAICADPTLPADDIPALLTRLVNTSLVLRDEHEGGMRYRFLETIRQYAREKLFAAGEAQTIHERHCAWFGAWAEQTAPTISCSQELSGFGPVATELDNLRAALAWAAETGAAATLAQLVVALGWFWEMRGALREGTGWVQQALAAADLPAPVRARVCFTAGRLAFRRSDPGEGGPILSEALTTFRTLADPLWTAHTLLALGAVHGHHGSEGQVDGWFAESLALFRALGDQPGQARALNHLGERHRFQGRPTSAAPLYRESLTLAQAINDEVSVAIAVVNLGHVATQQGAGAAAAAYYAEGLQVVQRLGYWLLAPEALEGRAALAAGAGAPLQAARLFAAAAAVRTALGTPLTPAERESYEPAVAAAQAGVDPAAWAAAWATGARLDLEQAIAEACAALPAA